MEFNRVEIVCRVALAASAAIVLTVIAQPVARAETSTPNSTGSDEHGIKLPSDGDEYSGLVARAAAHDEKLDFRALRLAFLASAARKRAGADLTTVPQLEAEALKMTQATEGAAIVRAKTEQILSIDFTDMLAHKLLRQACVALHDDACAELHHFIEFGLLNSIVHSGDGKSCASGWEATQISEEYFMLRMIDVRLMRQALVSDGGHACDAMFVTNEGGVQQTYFFKIDQMMAAEQAELLGSH